MSLRQFFTQTPASKLNLHGKNHTFHLRKARSAVS